MKKIYPKNVIFKNYLKKLFEEPIIQNYERFMDFFA